MYKKFLIYYFFLNAISTINAKLAEGYAVILSPGVYNLESSIIMSKDNNIMYAMGWPIIDNKNNNGPAINVTGSNCIIAGGMLADAGSSNVDALISISSGTGARMYDVCCRVLRPTSQWMVYKATTALPK